MSEIILPNFIEDIKQKLAWNKNYKGWPKKRILEDIRGVCFHQTWGNSDPVKVNNYHTGPNHISKKGCPHICYTIFIDGEGKVTLCNDWRDITWSQGTSKMPGDENKFFVSVCVGGKFKNKYSPDSPDPSIKQMESIDMTWKWLKMTFDLLDGDIFGHFDFGKATCPGDAIEKYIKEIRSKEEILLVKVEDWQSALQTLGYYKGKIDGLWDQKSRLSLYNFQKDHFRNDFQISGTFDRPTAWILRELMENK